MNLIDLNLNYLNYLIVSPLTQASVLFYHRAGFGLNLSAAMSDTGERCVGTVLFNITNEC